MREQIPLIKGDEVGIETDYRDALPVNMIAIPKQILGASGYMLCHPGIDAFATVSGIDRGGVFNDRQTNHFRLSGTDFIEVDAAGTPTVLGSITGTDQATIEDFYSFNTQGVIAGGQMHLYDPIGGFVKVTDPDLGVPIDGVWIDGYYFLTDGEFLFHTDLDDETAIDPLKFATAEFSPDPTLGVGKTQDNKAIAFGRYSIEYFANTANDNFAFTRLNSRALKIGIVSTHAKCEVAGNWYITGGRKKESLGVHVFSVGTTAKISTREVDKILGKYSESDLSNMRMETREEDDVTLIYIHLPDECLCFNQTIAGAVGREMAWSILTTGSDADVWRGINGINDPRISGWIFGDKTEGVLGRLNDTGFAQFGEASELILFTPFLNLETMTLDEIEIETIPGLNVIDDATLAFSMTKDGLTWSTEYWSMIGEPLDYNKRYIIRRLGNINQWVGLKFRAVTTSRMSFAMLAITYG